MTSQVVSKQRVAEHGEVFTSPREVNAMLDLVKQETERVDLRFLEPACGTGNFLTEILTRKLKVVERKYRKSQLMTVGPQPNQIIFSEWSFPFNDSRLKRREFVFAELIPDESARRAQPGLFSKSAHVSDLGEKVFLPTETHGYPLIHFLKIADDPAV